MSRENTNNTIDPRKESWPFGVALFAVLFAGLSVGGFLLYWAIPSFWPHPLVIYELENGEEVLALNVSWHDRKEISETGDLALVADSDGLLRSSQVKASVQERAVPANDAIFVTNQSGQRLAFKPLEIRYQNEQYVADSDAFYDKMEEAVWASSLSKETADTEDVEGQLVGESKGGQEIVIPIDQIVEFYGSAQGGFLNELGIYIKRIANYLTSNPRGGTTSGGIFPAIVGTFFLTVVMSLIVAPLGVIVALYLSEYARPGNLLNGVRIALNNLAGIPSVIYGVFGLGFFVYFVGGHVDRQFFADTLPSPTFGTGGVLWASLAMALMTLPIVIVSTEQSLRAVSKRMRDASMALGASKWQTIWRVVLPYATPGLLTGLILAVARAAGEVAPLMLLGVTRLAPQILVSGDFPFFHFEGKFMHLGYHVYDLTFHSSNSVEAVPFVFVTSLLLVGLIFFMNLTAVIVRRVLLEQQRKLGSL